LRKSRGIRPRYRPVLEALEDRLAPAVLTVNSAADNTTDTTVLTLRDALTLVNNGGDPTSLGQPSMPMGWANQISGTFGSNDTIDFAIASSGTQTIVLASALPAITSKILIDGTSEPGYAGQPLLVINAATNSVPNGLEIDASGIAAIKGLQIEGATSAGILLSGGGGNLVIGNWLTGNADGLLVEGSNNNTLGGTAAGDGNLISGNLGNGLTIEVDQNLGTGGTGNLVEGNFIGTDASGAAANGNGGDGVYVTGSGNTIGGQASGAANVIAFNSNDGVQIQPNQVMMGGQASPANQDPVSANSIHNNGHLGIELTGGNNNQPAPAITAAGVSAGQVQIQGTLTAAANTKYTLEFFGSPPGSGEAHDFLGSTSVTTDPSSKAPFTFSAPIPATDHIVTATATDPNNNTSQFSVMQGGTAILTVNSAADNTSDTTVLTLRDALTLVNNGGDPSSLGQASMPSGWNNQIAGIFGNNDSIDFKIASSGTQSIVLTSDLPAISSPVTIDGTSEPGYAGQPLVVINANTVANNGLMFDAGGNPSGSMVEGLEIEGATNAGIDVSYLATGRNGGITVVRNWLTGNKNGLLIYGTNNNTIGGSAAGAGNVISANPSTGITISCANDGNGGIGNLVEGNFIGTDASGTSADGNGTGVYVVGTNASNTIGGTTLPSAAGGAGNLISGNSGTGIILNGLNNLVEGNYIGTQLDGQHVLPNGDGIALTGEPNTIGGTAIGAGNLISGNLGIGINDGSLGSVIEGNFIGTDKTGTSILTPTGTAIGNKGDGVDMQGGDTLGGTAGGAGNVIAGNGGNGVNDLSRGGLVVGNFIGTDAAGGNLGNALNGVYLTSGGATIGGQASGAANVIAFNGNDGVLVSNAGSTDTKDLISANSIHNNAKLGIELSSGANNNQPAPVITSAGISAGQLQIQGTLTAAVNTKYVIEFFASPAADPSGAGEGQEFLGSTTATTDPNGNASFTFASPNGDNIVTATATDPNNNTSEFSAPKTVSGNVHVPPSIVTAPVSQAVDAGATVMFTATASGRPAPTVQWQVKPPGATAFLNIAGATATTLSFSAGASQNGDQLQAVFTNSAGTATTKAVKLTVSFAPIIKIQPISKTAAPGAMVKFTAAATANPAISKIQWYVSSDGQTWNPLAKQTSATLKLTATAALSNNQYRVVFTNSVGSTTTSSATLLVNAPPVVTLNPLTQAALAGHSVTFQAAATVASGTPAATVQWQVSSDGGLTWTDLMGQTNMSLIVNAVAGLEENQYRAIFSNSGGKTATKAATLFVF